MLIVLIRSKQASKRLNKFLEHLEMKKRDKTKGASLFLNAVTIANGQWYWSCELSMPIQMANKTKNHQHPQPHTEKKNTTKPKTATSTTTSTTNCYYNITITANPQMSTATESVSPVISPRLTRPWIQSLVPALGQKPGSTAPKGRCKGVHRSPLHLLIQYEQWNWLIWEMVMAVSHGGNMWSPDVTRIFFLIISLLTDIAKHLRLSRPSKPIWVLLEIGYQPLWSTAKSIFALNCQEHLQPINP